MSKIPEGATHTAPDKTYRRKVGKYWLTYADGDWIFVEGAAPQHYTPIQAEPEWSGEGLPPVGAVCAFCRLPDTPESEWQKVEVVAHWSKGLKNPVAIFMSTSFAPQADQAIAKCFRPLPTAEQVAAEEREKAIKEICIDAGSPEMTPGQLKVAEKLYMAGYRKQVTK